MNTFSRVWLALILVSGIWSTSAPGASVNVPLEHWSYRAIDALIGYGAIRTALVGTKPFTRDEMARLIAEAMQRVGSLPEPQQVVANNLLTRLRWAFREEVRFYTGEAGALPSTYLKPLDQAAAQVVYLDGKPTGVSGLRDATEGTPLVRNNEGIDYQDGGNVLLTTTSHAKLWQHFAFFVQPIFTLHGDLDDTLDADIRLHKGYVKGSLGPFELEFGRDAVRWGQGDRGTLIFSDHAQPLEFLQISTPHPVLLPWIFQYIGLIKGAMFVAVLEEDRDVSRAKVVGVRVQIKPFRWLEFGAVAGVQLDRLSFNDLLDILLARSGTEQTNQLLALDLRLTLPFLRYTQIYFEYGGNDRGGPFDNTPNGLQILFADVAFVVGLYVPRLTDDGRTTFRFEWMQNAFVNDATPSIWYTHSQFTSGFTYKGRVLGHANGGDSADYFWRLTRDVSDQAVLGVDFAYQWRGDLLLPSDNSLARERHVGGGVDLQYFVTPSWEVNARFAMEKVRNFNLQPGNDQVNTILWLNIRYHFL